MEYNELIKSYRFKGLIQDCYEDYVEECDADWQPENIKIFSKSDWLKTDDAKSFILQAYKRGVE